jgi:hypothetical protein
MNDFDIKKFLTENKMTRNSRLLSEGKKKEFKIIKKLMDQYSSKKDSLETFKEFVADLNKLLPPQTKFGDIKAFDRVYNDDDGEWSTIRGMNNYVIQNFPDPDDTIFTGGPKNKWVVREW